MLVLRFDRQRHLRFLLCLVLAAISYAQEDVSAAIDVPQDMTPPRADPSEHKVKFLFCQRSGMKRDFASAKSYLEGEFPGLNVDGDNYPPPPLIELLMKVMQGIQLMAMGLIIFGDGLWTNILQFRAVPSFYYQVKQYSFQVGVLVFFIVPKMLNKYIITGAFEMILDGVTVYSKLETGRMPHAGDLLSPLEAIGLLKGGR